MRRLLTFLGCLIATVASAQNNRSFVSTTGNDANNCTTGFECRSFTRAMSVTNPGGEILAISSGGYGAFTIPKAVTVMGAPGVAAEITITTGDAIGVAAGSTDRVVIRGINITNTGGGNGILATTFGLLSIENCSITGGSNGIISGGGLTSFTTITDTTVRASGYGITLSNNGALSHCRLAANANVGLDVSDVGVDVHVAASDLVSVDNGGAGVGANNSFGHTISLAIDRSLLSANSVDGLVSSNPGAGTVHVFVSYSTVVQNGRYGLNNTVGSDLASMKNNLVADNAGGDTSGAITSWPGQ